MEVVREVWILLSLSTISKIAEFLLHFPQNIQKAFFLNNSLYSRYFALNLFLQNNNTPGHHQITSAVPLTIAQQQLLMNKTGI